MGITFGAIERMENIGLFSGGRNAEQELPARAGACSAGGASPHLTSLAC